MVQEGGIRALPTIGSHTELPSTPSRKELTLLHRLAFPLNGQLIHQKPYIIGNEQWQTKMSGVGAEGIYP